MRWAAGEPPRGAIVLSETALHPSQVRRREWFGWTCLGKVEELF